MLASEHILIELYSTSVPADRITDERHKSIFIFCIFIRLHIRADVFQIREQTQSPGRWQ